MLGGASGRGYRMLHIATKIPEGRHLITTSASWAPLASRRKATRGSGTLGGDEVPGQQLVPFPSPPPRHYGTHTLTHRGLAAVHLLTQFLVCLIAPSFWDRGRRGARDGESRGRCHVAGFPRASLGPVGRGRRRLCVRRGFGDVVQEEDGCARRSREKCLVARERRCSRVFLITRRK